MDTIIARWQDWSSKSLEHLVLKQAHDRIIAEAAVLGSIDDQVFAARYKIACDLHWHVAKVEIAGIGSDSTAVLASDCRGKWVDGSGAAQPHLDDTIDIDLSITPFTNTLPIRRLNLQAGQSQEIVVVYVQLPDLTITTDRQRYTCIQTGRLYRYESVDSGFTREIEVDTHGLVVTYPGLFRRIL